MCLGACCGRERSHQASEVQTLNSDSMTLVACITSVAPNDIQSESVSPTSPERSPGLLLRQSRLSEGDGVSDHLRVGAMVRVIVELARTLNGRS